MLRWASQTIPLNFFDVESRTSAALPHLFEVTWSTRKADV